MTKYNCPCLYGFVAWLLAAAVLFWGFQVDGAARAQDLSLEPAFNPHPHPNDVEIPMPGGLKMLFQPVQLEGTGDIGGSERVFQIGGDKSPQQFSEYPRLSRIGSSIVSRSGKPFLLFGKYEVSIAQFAVVIGNGDLAAGLEILRKNAQIEQLPATPEADIRFLARPVHGLSYEDYQQFIRLYNDWCLTDPSCLQTLKERVGGIGFFRLPLEHEWEYVARDSVRAPLPFGRAQISEFALIDNPRRRSPDAIGQRKPLANSQIYDIFGNVAELMATPYTLDNGSGAVGGWVARGGDYKTAANSLRASLREEIRPFIRSEIDGKEVVLRSRPREVGIRLTLGTAVLNPDNRNQIKNIIGEMTNYAPLGEAKGGVIDLAGNTRLDAKDLGTLDAKAPSRTFADSVGAPGDPADWFSFILPSYGNLAIELKSTGGALTLEYRHSAQEVPGTVTIAENKTERVALEGLKPGQMFVRIMSQAGEARYSGSAVFNAIDAAPNTIKDAAPLALTPGRPNIVSDYVGPGDSVDVYKVELRGPSSLYVRLMASEKDAAFEILDSSEAVLATIADPNWLLRSYSLPKAAPGVYYIRVLNKKNEPTLYKLMASSNPIDIAGATRETALDLGQIASQNVPVVEHLGRGDTIDTYKFEITEPSLVAVRVAQQTANIDIFIYDATGKVIEKATKPGVEREEVLFIRRDGTYFAEIKLPDGGETDYSLTIEALPRPNYSHPDIAYGMPLSPGGSTFRTKIAADSFRQWAEFDVATPTTVRIQLYADNTVGAVDLDLLLFSVAKSDWKLTSAKSGTSSEEIVTRLEPGRYRILVARDNEFGLGTADARVQLASIASTAANVSPSAQSTPQVAQPTPPVSSERFNIDQDWGDVSGWRVGYNKLRGHCLGIASYTNFGTVFVIGVDPRNNLGTFGIFDQRWGGIVTQRDYDTEFIFGGGGRWRGKFAGVITRFGPGVEHNSIQINFLRDVAGASSVSVAIEGGRQGRFSLSGTRNALNAMVDCYNKLGGR